MPRLTKNKENAVPASSRNVGSAGRAKKAAAAPVHKERKAPARKASAKAGKGTKAKKDPNAPKRPTTSYFFFAAEKRAEIKADNPDEKLATISKIMGAMWRELPAAEKKPYLTMAEKDKQRYADELQRYGGPPDSEEDDSSSDE